MRMAAGSLPRTPFAKRYSAGEASLASRYNVPDDTIVFDEIISAIIVTVEDSNGAQIAISRVDPNWISLNPNRATLGFSLTL